MTATDGAGPAAGWLARVIAAAVENVHAGGGPFAALLVREGTEVGRGANRVTLDNDPTAYAEVVALRDAGRRLGDFRLGGRRRRGALRRLAGPARPGGLPTMRT